jgi:fructose-bisphosphate aldolase class II
VAIPAFCTENCWTTEAVLKAALRAGERCGIAEPPVAIGFTASYPARSNLGNYLACGDLPVGLRAALADLRALVSPGSPYARCRVLPHLDHGQPDADRWILEDHVDDFAMVMFDAGALPLEQNIERTADYVRRFSDRVVIEGAVAELKEARAETDAFPLTPPEVAARFLAETGCDLIVPNVGTEHRAAEEGEARYHGEHAARVGAEAGPNLVLHGTSSMERGELARVPRDGFVKVNIWTIMEATGGRWLADYVLENLDRMLDEGRLRDLVASGVLGHEVLSDGADDAPAAEIGPDIERLALAGIRRGWVEEVTGMLEHFFDAFGYERLPARQVPLA